MNINFILNEKLKILINPIKYELFLIKIYEKEFIYNFNVTKN